MKKNNINNKLQKNLQGSVDRMVEGGRWTSFKFLFQDQLNFQKKIKSGIGNKISDKKRNELYREHCLHTIEEIIEGLREIDHKPWKKTKQIDNLNKLKNELIDEFRFFINRCILMGMEPDEFLDRLRDSYKKTNKRIKNKY